MLQYCELKGRPEAYVVNQVVEIMWLLHIMQDTIIYTSGRPLIGCVPVN